MALFKSDTFPGSTDDSKNLANQGNQVIEFFHVPTGHSVRFKAFLTAFDDAYTSEWNSENTFGRMDPLQSFQRTGRKIGLGFDVVAGSSQEAYNNLDRISLLLQMLYPSYEAGRGGATSIKAAPYFKISFMNLISSFISEGNLGASLSGLLGTVDGFTYSPNLEAGFYHGAVGDSFEAWGAGLFPKVVSLACTFTVLHQGQLGWVKKEQRDKFQQFPYKEAPKSFSGAFADEDPFADELPKSEEQIKNDANDVMLEATANAILIPVTEPGGGQVLVNRHGVPQPKPSRSTTPSKEERERKAIEIMKKGTGGKPPKSAFDRAKKLREDVDSSW